MGPKITTKKTPKTIEETYQKKTPIEHILLRPDTYIGDVKIQKEMMWVYCSQTDKIIEKEINYSPGLYKIFDEIIVNAGDRVQEDKTCNIIKVTINSDTNTISVWNNGLGVPVKMHQEHNLYVPSLIFGELLTGSNYDDEKERTTGGRNGYGAKLANIYSTFFSVETVDGDEKLKFYQEFKNNMSIKEKPKITTLKTESPKTYTCITFQPELSRFGLSSLTSDIVSLFEKRVYDMAGVYNHITVYLNDKKIVFNNFKKYIEMYKLNIQNVQNNDSISDDEETDTSKSSKISRANKDLVSKTNSYEIIYEDTNPRWKIGVVYAPNNDFKQISFVNGICTYHGGSHVNYIVDNIIDKIKVQIAKKHKDLTIKPSSIKENIIIFINSVIINPAFTSQVKETLKTKVVDFGSTCELSDKFIKKVYASGIVDQVINLVKMKQDSLLKKSDGKKTSKISGIPKLEDANFAGTKKSSQCYLILTEGDSAKALAMAGLSVIGQDCFGVFPLKGKLLNVREATSAQIMKNEEIVNIKKIIGLQQGKTYKDTSELRYKGIIIMADQDVDGFHIKGLLINFIHFFWPSLINTGDFIFSLQTPIVKAIKGKEAIEFYNLTEYNNWKEKNNISSYRIKYYKGLGTSTKEEAKQYFTGLEEKLLKYSYENTNGATDNIKIPDETENFKSGLTEQSSDQIVKKTTKKCIDYDSDEDDEDENVVTTVTRKYNDDTTEAITLAFEKDRSNDRKAWLMSNDKKKIIPQPGKNISIPNFINKEMILFSYDDCDRSLPSVCDGLKPSQRKVLYGTFLKKLYTSSSEIRVSQLAAYVSEKTAYHHGEASVVGTIVKMAQDFIGSNNINVLVPSGQFGCLAPETPVFLWNGIITNAENIKIGDELIGDDGNKRTVTQITSGIDDMYEIIDTKGKKLVVNSQHILTLYYPENNVIKWKESHNTWYFNYFDGIEIKTISIKICINPNDENNHYNKSKLTKDDGYIKIMEKSIEIQTKYKTLPIIDIKLTDYLTLSTFAKRGIYMISNLNNINWPKKKVPIDPYIFGAWLGDGDHMGMGFTSADEEIIKSFALWADTINAEISHHKSINHDGYHYLIRRKGSGSNPAIGDINHSCENCIGCKSSNVKLNHNVCDWYYEKIPAIIEYNTTSHGHIRNDLNPFVQLLKNNNLHKNKHIPNDYLINDEETRLELLAGFIDTDGTIRDNGTEIVNVEISQSERLHGNLIEKLDFIAKSLGFSTSIYSSQNNKFTKKGESSSILTLKIFGNNLTKIPTRIERKKIIQLKRDSKTEHFTKFSVEHIGKNKFCGWSIDGNERFLLGNFIVTHNSRCLGGSDHASARYIQTYITPQITRAIYKIEDDAILNYLDDDGEQIEPEWFIPVLPMILVNGAKGIGTGFSTTVPKYSPKEIAENLIAMIDNKVSDIVELKPWYKDFKGSIISANKPGSYLIYGKYQVVDDVTIRVTELPIGLWTDDYKEFLENEIIKKNIVSYTSNNTDETVEFTIIFEEVKLDKLIKKKEIYTKLKLVSRISINNMWLYNYNGIIKKYTSPQDILCEFYQVRLDMYTKRKNWLKNKIHNELDILQYKMKFIQYVLDGKITVFKQKKSVIIDKLIELKFPKLITRISKSKKDKEDDEDNDINDDSQEEDSNKSYEYITSMPLFSLTDEKINELQDKLDNKQQELVQIESTSEKDQWKLELNEFLTTYKIWSETKPETFIIKSTKSTKKTVKATKKAIKDV